MGKKNLEEVIWKGNSRKMYEAILNSTPKLFQKSIIKLATKWVQEHNVEVVTEEMIFQVVEDVAPIKVKSKILQALESMKTK
ncbi:hypothetical protein [Clostridium amazonitimonense]|uniref:hypothetical protein n=1 Tax=Clostridium amazonitimonense TaxID=1499689 RepID=UPI0005096010|nr:hypothetical protein [Clostridium amazonitimonense]